MSSETHNEDAQKLLEELDALLPQLRDLLEWAKTEEGTAKIRSFLSTRPPLGEVAEVGMAERVQVEVLSPEGVKERTDTWGLTNFKRVSEGRDGA